MASLPGWHATIDGRPLTLSPYLTMMFQAHIPPGRHVIELTYWPTRFTEGIVLAALAVVGIVAVGVIGRRRSSPAASAESGASENSSARAERLAYAAGRSRSVARGACRARRTRR